MTSILRARADKLCPKLMCLPPSVPHTLFLSPFIASDCYTFRSNLDIILKTLTPHVFFSLLNFIFYIVIMLKKKKLFCIFFIEIGLHTKHFPSTENIELLPPPKIPKEGWDNFSHLYYVPVVSLPLCTVIQNSTDMSSSFMCTAGDNVRSFTKVCSGIHNYLGSELVANLNTMSEIFLLAQTRPDSEPVWIQI